MEWFSRWIFVGEWQIIMVQIMGQECARARARVCVCVCVCVFVYGDQYYIYIYIYIHIEYKGQHSQGRRVISNKFSRSHNFTHTQTHTYPHTPTHPRTHTHTHTYIFTLDFQHQHIQKKNTERAQSSRIKKILSNAPVE